MFHTSEKLLHDKLHILKKGGVNPQILMKSDDLYVVSRLQNQDRNDFKHMRKPKNTQRISQ